MVSADALDIRNSRAAFEWGRWLSLSVVVADWDAALTGVAEDFDAARDEFGAWLDDRGHEAVDDVLPFAEIVNEDEEFRRACLAAWRAAFGTP